MITGIISLSLAYVLSQFFRSFLAVLTGILGQDIGATPDDLSTASGLWFLSFALMQIPVGGALDRIGPRLTSAVLFLIGGAGGAALFAMAQSALHVKLAMLLIGIGCSLLTIKICALGQLVLIWQELSSIIIISRILILIK